MAPWRERLDALVPAPATLQLGYRERVALHAEHAAEGWRLGLRRRDRLIAIPDCPVHSARVNGCAAALLERLPSPERIALAFYVHNGGQATLVVKSGTCDTAWVDDALTTRLAALGLDGLWLNLHPAAGHRLFAKRGWRLLWGRPHSHDADGLRYGPAAFRQAHGELHAGAVEAAARFLAVQPGDAVADLYCGLGATLRRWTASAADTAGVELDGDALEHAHHNAPGATLWRGACAARLPQLEAWQAKLPAAATRLLYVNPPRSGLESQVVDWTLDRFRPQRIAYLSCSAASLRRDLEELTAGGYRVEGITPYDFFPGTEHVETLARLTREDR